MHKTLILLFAIPLISFVVIALYQVLEETFKKEFVLERRTAEEDPAEAPKRRYVDAVGEAKAGYEKDAPVAQVHGA